MAGPLDGVRVVDLSAMASGPLATTLLAEQGADVVKVEPPGTGDLLRRIGTSRGGISAVFNVLNRGKRSIALDLAAPEGVDVLRGLVRKADVFVQNFRPGAVDRMGIGYDALAALAPGLVYVSICGFGEQGPRAQHRVYDSVMQAMSGIAAHQADPGSGRPEFVHNIVCDKVTALHAAQSICAALFARERGAGGQHLRLSMLDASIAFLWPDGMQNHTYLGEGTSAPIARGALPAIRPCADGWMTITAINDAEFRGLCAVLERPDLLDDPRFADAGGRTRNAAALHAEVSAVTGTRTTAELAARLAAEDVPHAVVNRLETLHEDPQVLANGLLVESEHPAAGRMRAPRPVVRFQATQAAPVRPAPLLGEHTDAVLGELGLPPDAIASLRSAGVAA